jgi:hypothetical protein
MAIRDYSSIYSIKDFAVNTLAPKYFDMNVINLLNVGIFGYMTDLAGTIAEDGFNATTTYINEIFPNKAILPETIYTYASLFSIDNLFAKPAHLSAAILINEADIITYGTPVAEHLEFFVDSNLLMDVEGHHFRLDYDVKVKAKLYKGKYIFDAVYVSDFNNSLSDVTNPFVRVKELNYGSEKFLALIVKIRQVDYVEIEETLISNDKINIPTINFTYKDQLANFEVMYKALGSSTYTQLKKLPINSTPLTTPFCYYRFKDSNALELSFSTIDKYFQPSFGSDFIIKVYTTQGAAGNFPLYSGVNINLVPKSTKYDYNNSIILLGIVNSESAMGSDMLSTDALKNMVIEQFSTISSYTTINDLDMYFASFNYKHENNIMFVKKRDDVFDRIFSSFILFKDSLKETLYTNTLNYTILPAAFDHYIDQTVTYILKAGHLFKYKDGSTKSELVMLDNAMIYDGTSVEASTEDYLYTNPFLITLTNNPVISGFYLNSVNKTHMLDYSYLNPNAIMQFICNKVLVQRNALNGENVYTFSLDILPTLELPGENIIDPITHLDLGKLKIKGFFEIGGVEECYIDFTLASYDSTNKIYKYTATMTTDDYLTSTNKFRVTDSKTTGTGNVDIHYIPMVDAKINIKTFFKYETPLLNNTHPYMGLENLNLFQLTNSYDTLDDKITFIQPMNMIRSTNVYEDLGGGDFQFYLSSVPFVSAREMMTSSVFSAFIADLQLQYNYLLGLLSKLTNNYSLDLKFFNTYGRSKNYVVGDLGDIVLDKVNIKIKFKIKPNMVAIEEQLITQIRIFVKTYIESNLNMSGTSTNNIYISNIIRKIEEDYADVVYTKFDGINDYDTTIQVVSNNTVNYITLTADEKRAFVPEYLNVKLNDITIAILGD